MHNDLSTQTLDKVCKRIDRVLAKIAAGNVLVLPQLREDDDVEQYVLVGYQFPGLGRIFAQTPVKTENGIFDSGKSKRIAWSKHTGIHIPVGFEGDGNELCWLMKVKTKPYAGFCIEGSYNSGGFRLARNHAEDFQYAEICTVSGHGALFDRAVAILLKRWGLRFSATKDSYAVHIPDQSAFFQLMMNPCNGNPRITDLLKTNVGIDLSSVPKYITQE